MQQHKYNHAFKVEQSTLWAIRALAHAEYSAWEQPIIDVDELCDNLMAEVYDGVTVIAYVDESARNMDIYAEGALSIDMELSTPDDVNYDMRFVEHATYCTMVDSNNLSYVQRALMACNYVSVTPLPPIMSDTDTLYVVWNHITRTYATRDTMPPDVAVLEMHDIADYNAFQYGPQDVEPDWSAVAVDDWSAVAVDVDGSGVDSVTPHIYYCPGYELFGSLAAIFGDQFSIPLHIALHAIEHPNAIFLVDKSQQLVWKGEPLC